MPGGRRRAQVMTQHRYEPFLHFCSQLAGRRQPHDLRQYADWQAMRLPFNAGEDRISSLLRSGEWRTNFLVCRRRRSRERATTSFLLARAAAELR